MTDSWVADRQGCGYTERPALFSFMEIIMVERRERLADERRSINRTKSFGNYKIAQIFGYNDKDQLKEVQFRAAKRGSIVWEFLQVTSFLISKCLVYGIKPESIAKRMEGIVSDPSGYAEKQQFESLSQYIAFLLRKYQKYPEKKEENNE